MWPTWIRVLWPVVRLQAAAWLIVNAPRWDLLPRAISHPDKHAVCVTLCLWHTCFHRLPTSSAIFPTRTGSSDTRPTNRNRRLSITDERGLLPMFYKGWMGTPLCNGSGWLEVWNWISDSICDDMSQSCNCVWALLTPILNSRHRGRAGGHRHHKRENPQWIKSWREKMLHLLIIPHTGDRKQSGEASITLM